MTTSSKNLSLLELVFEKRNKAYGAYVIRKMEDKLLLIGLFLTVSVFLLAFMAPEFFGNKKNSTPIIPEDTTGTFVHEFIPEPKIESENTRVDRTLVETVSSIIDLVPIVKKDQLVSKEDSLADQKKMLASNLGTKTHTGDSIGSWMGDTLGLGGGKKKPDPPVVFDVGKVPVKPQFRNGDADLITYIVKNVDYPDFAYEIGIEGTVYVQFVIDAQGFVTQTEIKKGADKLLDKEALKVISNMPEWKPGMQNGHAVAVRMIIPIKFEIID